MLWQREGVCRQQAGDRRHCACVPDAFKTTHHTGARACDPSGYGLDHEIGNGGVKQAEANAFNGAQNHHVKKSDTSIQREREAAQCQQSRTGDDDSAR